MGFHWVLSFALSLSLSLCQISSLAILVVSIGGADGGGCGSY